MILIYAPLAAAVNPNPAGTRSSTPSRLLAHTALHAMNACRYFLHTWPHLCFLAFDGQHCFGTVSAAGAAGCGASACCMNLT